MALNDAISNFKGASIINQLLLAINHSGAAAPEFMANNILPFSGGAANVASIGYSAIALGASYGIAVLQESAEIEKYKVTDVQLESLEKAVSSFKLKPEIKADVLRHMNSIFKDGLGQLVPKGGILKTTATTFFAFQAARLLARHGAATALNILRNVPFFGEKFLGKGRIKPNDNFILAAQLGEYREDLIKRMDRGDALTDADRLGGYGAGVILRQTRYYKT